MLPAAGARLVGGRFRPAHPMNYFELLKLASPEAVMVITALVVLALQAIWPLASNRKHFAAATGIVRLAAAREAARPPGGTAAQSSVFPASST